MVTRQIAGILLALFLLATAAGIARSEIPVVPDAKISAPTRRLLHRITRRLEKLQNVAVTYHQFNDYTPPPKLVAAITHNPINSNLTVNVGRRRSTCRFSFLDGRAFYESRAISGSHNLGLLRQIRTYTPQRAESLI